MTEYQQNTISGSLDSINLIKDLVSRTPEENFSYHYCSSIEEVYEVLDANVGHLKFIYTHQEEEGIPNSTFLSSSYSSSFADALYSASIY